MIATPAMQAAERLRWALPSRTVPARAYRPQPRQLAPAKGSDITKSRRRQIAEWDAQGVSQREMAARLKVSRTTVCGHLRVLAGKPYRGGAR